VSIGKLIKWAIIIVFIIGLLIIYSIFDPANTDLFPKCPFRQITGYKCPGCGSQRAIHHLLSFDIFGAFKDNMLLVVSIPYIITGAIFDLVKQPSQKFLKWRKFFFGTKAIFIVLGIIISFWILRNIYGF